MQTCIIWIFLQCLQYWVSSLGWWDKYAADHDEEEAHENGQGVHAVLELMSDVSLDPEDMDGSPFTKLNEPCDFMHNLWRTGAKKLIGKF